MFSKSLQYVHTDSMPLTRSSYHILLLRKSNLKIQFWLIFNYFYLFLSIFDIFKFNFLHNYKELEHSETSSLITDIVTFFLKLIFLPLHFLSFLTVTFFKFENVTVTFWNFSINFFFLIDIDNYTYYSTVLTPWTSNWFFSISHFLYDLPCFSHTLHLSNKMYSLIRWFFRIFK